MECGATQLHNAICISILRYGLDVWHVCLLVRLLNETRTLCVPAKEFVVFAVRESGNLLFQDFLHQPFVHTRVSPPDKNAMASLAISSGLSDVNTTLSLGLNEKVELRFVRATLPMRSMVPTFGG